MKLLPALLLLALPFLFSCGGEAKAASPVIGTWTLDVEGSVAGMTEDEKAMLGEMLKQMKFSITFAEDNTINGALEVMGTTDNIKGTWSSDGNAITATTTSDSKPEEIVQALTLDGEKLTLPAMDGAPGMVLMKQ